jgi:hypothetical protein
VSAPGAPACCLLLLPPLSLLLLLSLLLQRLPGCKRRVGLALAQPPPPSHPSSSSLLIAPAPARRPAAGNQGVLEVRACGHNSWGQLGVGDRRERINMVRAAAGGPAAQRLACSCLAWAARSLA